MATLIYTKGYAPIHTKKIRPNDLCPCGSGKKAKKCCGTERKYFYLKKQDKTITNDTQQS